MPISMLSEKISDLKVNGWTIERVATEMVISRVTLSQNLSRNPTVNT